MRIIPFLAFKDMVRDRKIVLLVIFLLAFSYVNLTFFPAFLNGLSNTFQDEIVDTGTSHIIITPRLESNSPYLNFVSSTRKKIDLIPGVAGSSSHIGLSGTVFFEGKQTGVGITALTPSDDSHVTAIGEKILKGDYLSDGDTGEIVMGELIAGRKIEDRIGQTGGFGAATEGLGGVDVGQKVVIRFSNGVESEFRVKGISGSQGFSLVSQTIYMTAMDAEEILGIDDQASSILVRLNNKDDAARYKKLILELGLSNANIQTWSEASTFAEGLNQTFGIVIIVTTIVGIVIVMATVGIVIFINTSRKRRIIGVLKAIGMQKNHLMMVFLFESLLFGLIGTLLGAAIVYSTVYYMNIHPIVLPIGALKPVLLTSTAVNAVAILIASSLVAGYIPSRLASRQEILETIKVVE
ncbi:MAG: ABC transporter permease [Candidatus Aenigmarchaeota archaeon]|nr:ABC transporter permease [Candidatus Aenigmarchaeota archaeon]